MKQSSKSYIPFYRQNLDGHALRAASGVSELEMHRQIEKLVSRGATVIQGRLDPTSITARLGDELWIFICAE